MPFFSIFLLTYFGSFFSSWDIASSSHFTQPTIKQNNIMIKKYTAYNFWANQQMAQWMENLPDSLFAKEIESSFPSLEATVHHIWNAEAGWLNHIQDQAWGEAPSKNFVGKTNDVLKEWLKTSEAFDAFTQNMSEEQLLKTKTNTSNGQITSYIDMIHHCMNHSTYHRGQLITMGRQLGLKNPPRTDFIYYVRIKQTELSAENKVD